MFASRRAGYPAIFVCLVVLVSTSIAQRPANASTCDYYAQRYYGSNTSDTQQRFITHLVSLAFEGGSKLYNVSSDLTGILRPGNFSRVGVDLLQFFNGSKPSTNVNNAPIGINWLDQGGTAPLASYLAGDVDTLGLNSTSNQYLLFGNFFFVFSRLFGCTLPFPPPPTTGGAVSLAYAHKFMNLDYYQLGYFIDQLAQASMYYGFSTQDAETFRTRMNSQYNVRCAPAVSINPALPPQLLSLCQNPSCPLAVPVSDCAAYVNLTASGVASSSPTTVVQTATASATLLPTNNPSPSSTPAAAASSDSLSSGAIAGIAIGGAAVALLGVVALLLFRRRRRSTPPPTPAEQPASSVAGVSRVASPVYNHDSAYTPKDGHMSYFSAASEMDTSRYHSPVDRRIESSELSAYPGYAHPGSPGAPVEMESAPPAAQPWNHGQAGGPQARINDPQ